MTKQYFCVGTYSEPILFGTGELFCGKGKGLYLCTFEDGTIKTERLLPVRNPSFFCINERDRKIYAVNELKEYKGCFGGGLTEISYQTDGDMRILRDGCTCGSDPCHVVMSPEREFLVVSNFANGSVAVFRLDGEGGIAAKPALFQHAGGSVHPVRQKGPHAHSAVFSHNSDFLVPDLGLDKLMAYRYENGEVSFDPESTVPVKPGNGPRFGEFSPDGKLLERETLSTLPEGCETPNICSDLHITPDGRYLYASNRGHDTLVCYRVQEDGELACLSQTPCGGRTPRNFAIDPAGNYILVGNQDTDSIAVFRIGASGALEFVSNTPFPTPVCIRFFYDAAFDCQGPSPM